MRDVRVFYQKNGRMKFASHLDMNRLMIRTVRLAKIPIWYTEGFNKHPYLNFAVPLSLGFTGEYEIMDLRIIDDSFSNEMVKNALSEVFPEGLTVTAVNTRVKKTGEIAFARFRITFDYCSSDFSDRLKEFLSQESIITEKRTKKGTYKQIDLAPFIKEYAVNSNDSGTVLDIVLPSGGENNINPVLLLSVLEDIPPYDICRTMLYDSSMERFA